ncbi:hypothetical protein Taro_039387 [Colocasia esculenta]|uniref:Uncharacterized protein n=1 Tax=Colocasia esculenta TaxID=4460 RepID=A0A843WM29_COLES|nr:hypothetical protein [Colocasia esculenta]
MLCKRPMESGTPETHKPMLMRARPYKFPRSTVWHARYKELKPASKARLHLQPQAKQMAAVTYGPLIVASHAKCGYLTTPLVFGDFPAVVGSPYFLGEVPAVQATPMAAPKATAARGSKPRPSQGRVFSVNTISCVVVPRKRGQYQGHRGSKPRAIVSNSGKIVLVGDVRIRLDGGEPIMPRDRSVPTVATSNKFAPLQGMRQEKRDSPKGARPGQASSSAPQPPRKMRQMWVTKQETRQIKQSRAGHPTEDPKKATPEPEKAWDLEPPRLPEAQLRLRPSRTCCRRRRECHRSFRTSSLSLRKTKHLSLQQAGGNTPPRRTEGQKVKSAADI